MTHFPFDHLSWSQALLGALVAIGALWALVALRASRPPRGASPAGKRRWIGEGPTVPLKRPPGTP